MPPSPELLFQIANPLALAGWVALVFHPLAPRPLDRIAFALPVVLSVLYAALILTYWAGAEGGFDSLPNVMRLFDFPGAALAGWVHYLGFDLLVGLWITRDARTRAIPHLLILPCLVLTFLFGPAGYLAYLALGLALRKGIPS